jgi:hypothetical protein
VERSRDGSASDPALPAIRPLDLLPRAQCRYDRSRPLEFVVCIRGISPSLEPKRDRAGIGFVPAHLQQDGTTGHTSVVNRGEQACCALASQHCLTTCQTTFSLIPSPQAVPVLQTHRNTLRHATPDARVHSSITPFTQSETGTVRMCPPLPTRSTIAQCSSRRWR